MADTFISECVVDGAELLESFDANEHGVYTYFVCASDDHHVYPSAYDGLRWSPIDLGDYDTDQPPCRCANCGLPPQLQRTRLSDGDEIRCADCGTTLRVIDG